jgi:hypothetical protein
MPRYFRYTRSTAGTALRWMLASIGRVAERNTTGHGRSEMPYSNARSGLF